MITLSRPAHWEEEIKKSRFLAHAARADSIAAAEAWIADRSEPAATHNCWAYRIGPDYRFSDDGEPAGTAGRPIYSAIEGQSLDHVVVLVIRYFGGIKLGTGGLMRAYGGCAAQCLRAADRIEVQPRVQLVVDLGFEHTGAIHALAEEFAADKLTESYTADGLSLTLSVEERSGPELIQRIRDATGGAASVRSGDGDGAPDADANP
ncbi:MAG: YigZ family protein [Xanthomonadales bacterium]|nr:YigZ family protein [Xanthomonadales bacterium]